MDKGEKEKKNWTKKLYHSILRYFSPLCIITDQRATGPVCFKQTSPLEDHRSRPGLKQKKDVAMDEDAQDKELMLPTISTIISLREVKDCGLPPMSTKGAIHCGIKAQL